MIKPVQSIIFPTLKYAKVRQVKSPIRAHQSDAGIDFFIPIFDKKFIKDFKDKNDSKYAVLNKSEIIVYANGRVLIPSGLHFNISDGGYALIAFNKSGVATKTGFTVGAAVIDENYQGEVHLSLLNTSNKDVIIYPGQKIIQFLYIPILNDIPTEVPFEKLYNKKTSRGKGGFGSTGS